MNVAHRLLLAIRNDVEALPSLQGILDDLNAAHDQLDLALERIGAAVDLADADAARRFQVIWSVPNPDPHGFDGDGDGIGCES